METYSAYFMMKRYQVARIINTKDEKQDWVGSKKVCTDKILLQEVCVEDITIVKIVTGHVTLLALMQFNS